MIVPSFPVGLQRTGVDFGTRSGVGVSSQSKLMTVVTNKALLLSSSKKKNPPKKTRQVYFWVSLMLMSGLIVVGFTRS